MQQKRNSKKNENNIELVRTLKVSMSARPGFSIQNSERMGSWSASLQVWRCQVHPSSTKIILRTAAGFPEIKKKTGPPETAALLQAGGCRKMANLFWMLLEGKSNKRQTKTQAFGTHPNGYAVSTGWLIKEIHSKPIEQEEGHPVSESPLEC